MNKWPSKAELNKFYGNPVGRDGHENIDWVAKNIVYIKPPFVMRFAGKTVSRIRVHRKCADSLLRVLNAIWIAAGKKQSVIDGWGFSKFGGVYEYRLARNSDKLSLHAYGAAGDWDALNKPLGQTTRRFVKQVVNAFKAEGWINKLRDPMHFQACSED
jgi:D-alanyl-D-alanine carboxypeptidase